MAVVLSYKTSDAKPIPVIIKKTKAESPFQKSKSIQEQYARALRGVAREVGKLIKGYAPKDQISAEKLRRALRAYAELIVPWAETVSKKIIGSINYQDYNAWRLNSQRMSIATRKEILSAPIGSTFEELMRENVRLITSIPLEAAERVHQLVTENLYKSARAEEIAKRIMETESVTKSRATLIARTEVARAASVLLQARATNIGSTGYTWRTSRDLIVRKAHKEMEGRFIKWAEPPTLSDKTVTHAGRFPNCRCWPEPEIPEIL